MLVTICVLIATAIIAVAMAIAFRHRHAVSRRITILLVGIFFSSLFLFFPCYLELSQAGIAEKGYAYPPVIRSVVYTLHYSLKAMGGGQEIDELETLIFAAPSAIRVLYFTLNYGFFIAASLLAPSLVFSLIGDWVDQLRCRFCLRRQYHIFSVLNANTLELAEKIAKNRSSGLLVFCNTKQAQKEQLAAAKALGAAVLHAPCTSLRLRLKNRHIQFYLVSPNEDTNLCQAEDLIRKYRNADKGTFVINAFAASETGTRMVESMIAKNSRIGVRFVDITALLCSNLMLQHPLHLVPEGSNTISVAIIGCDRTGMRMLKTVAWSGILDGYRLKIRVYDKNAPLLEKKLLAQCPEFKKGCDVAFIAVDAQSNDLERHILDAETGSADATYIGTAMGDDELNISVADRLSRLYRHHYGYRWMPQILARIRNATKSSIYKSREDSYLQQRNIYPFGGSEDMFSEAILHHSYLENLAFAVDLCYRDCLPEGNITTMSKAQLREYFTEKNIRSARSTFLQSSYNRRSSMAAALHIPAKLHRCGIGATMQDLTSAETAQKINNALKDAVLRDALARNEHLRWNQFMRSDGFVQATWEDMTQFYPQLEKKDSKDPLGKRHLCLTEWEQLDDLKQRCETLEPPLYKNFKKSDYDLIDGIGKILLLAIRMEEVSPDDL